MKHYVLSALLLVGLAGCSKKDDSAVLTPTDLLSAKNWRKSAQTTSTVYSTSSTPSVQDEYSSVQACRRDDFTKFNTDNTVTVDEGATRCYATDPQTRTYKWNLNSVTTQLTLNGIVYDVTTLSATTLSLRYVYSFTTSNGTANATATQDIIYTAF